MNFTSVANRNGTLTFGWPFLLGPPFLPGDSVSAALRGCYSAGARGVYLPPGGAGAGAGAGAGIYLFGSQSQWSRDKGYVCPSAHPAAKAKEESCD